MKTLALIALLASATARADGAVYTCLPGTQTNGLGIQKLVLDVSDEDPEATMTLSYLNGGRPVVSHMATEADDSRIEATPNSERDGEISVVLTRKSGAWLAHVKSESIDTFSILDCRRQ